MVSVIIPVYNVEKYIYACLKSLEAQTFKDFEVIIVNDGSPDRSKEIIEQYIKTTTMNVKLMNIPNSGVSAARNIGIEVAQGDYLCFVDADDMVDRSYLSVMVAEIQKYGSDVCICARQKINEEFSDLTQSTNQYTVRCMSSERALTALLYGDLSAGIWNLLVNKAVMSSLRFAEGYRYSEDLEMVWKLVATSEKIVWVDEQLYLYRVRVGSAMSIVDERRLDGLHLFKNLELFFSENVPAFSKKYNRYGVAKWVWSTLWQEAISADSYAAFAKRAKLYSAKSYLKRLVFYPRFKVAITSMIYAVSPRLYYVVMKFKKKRYRQVGQGT